MDICGPCKFRNQDKTAIKYCLTCEESQCNTCSDIHASSKATRKHLLLEIADLTKGLKTVEDLEKFQNCKDHTEKKLEFFCMDHDHFLCSACLLNFQDLECKTIVEIETAGEHLVKTKFNERISKELHDVIQFCRERENEIEKITVKSRSDNKEIQKYMADLKQTLIDQFEKCENEILTKIDAASKKRNSELKSQQTVLKETCQAALENTDILRKIVSNESNADIFRCLFSLIEQFEKLPVHKLSMATEICSHSVELSPVLYALTKSADKHPLIECKTTYSLDSSGKALVITEDKRSFLQTTKEVALSRNRKSLNDYTCSSSDADVEDSGTEPVKESKSPSQKGANKIADQSASLHEAFDKEINVSFVHVSDNGINIPDGNQPQITDIVMLTDGCIVLSDSKWSRLLRFKTNNLTYKDTAELSHPPGKMTVLNEKFLVVCFPTGNRFAFVSMSSEFKWMRNFKTIHSPRGLHALDNSRLLVSMKDDSENKWYLQILTTDGALSRDIGKTRLIQDASLISSLKMTPTSPRYYLQCCVVSNKLYCFDVNGREVFKYSAVSPKYLYVDRSGQIYILDSFCQLHILSNDGKLIQKVQLPADTNGLTCIKTNDMLIITKQSAATISVYQRQTH